ncbi:PREDICTED: uncharacterized protein LOC104802666 isoform X2 [Tarenaya hassleriana]|uniref:uncharacterized protein LOC104802666 isoform X2 n=1 Tax=Tarenaya hassleriana TaxID=28532 RepID=UPI00053C7462|nr:PREDICTED: uncharacterized protein LOC104802666 isoform X2 [Tarenaya hassleriana]
MAGEECLRKIRLFCPSVKKMIDWVASNEQRLDFGSIAAAFGLEPSTVKLNGHFISRGNDLDASCVTWRSLLAFFSAKGLSTGKDDGDALIVDGKLSKVGAKRPRFHLPGNDVGLFRSKKLKKDHSSATLSRLNGLGFKRKQLPEDRDNSLKKSKLNIDPNSDWRCEDVAETLTGVSSGGSFKPLKKCSFINGGLKRASDDELFASASCKRIRTKREASVQFLSEEFE